MNIRPLEVSELNSYISRIIDNDAILYNIKVKGEISNFKKHSSGNIYFSLKDESSKVKCIIFNKNIHNDIILENGNSIVAKGYISIYEKDGVYQLYIDSVHIDGVGKLHIEYNELKNRLEQLGMFEEKYKKDIPKIPLSAGIITSENGAVIKDIINVIKRRYPKIKLIIYPSSVQGNKSSIEVCKGISFFNNNTVDVIIIARGGGSIEELWSFNDENLAKEIFESKIPIISAIGHETDFTICDFVSDKRASTPSVAAEMITPSIDELLYKLQNCKMRLDSSIRFKLDIQSNNINHINEKIKNYVQINMIKDKVTQLDNIYDKIIIRSKNNIEKIETQLRIKGELLHNLSPLSTLNRGYSVIQKNGNDIKSIEDLNICDNIKVILNDGNIKCIIEDIQKNEV